jgi:hypothetical protein
LHQRTGAAIVHCACAFGKTRICRAMAIQSLIIHRVITPGLNIVRHHNRRELPGNRWLSICLRSLHLVGIVLTGVALFASQALANGVPPGGAAVLVLATGLGLFGIDLWRNPRHWQELAGAFILLKLLLVLIMVFVPAAAHVIFWILLVASSTISHAPAAFRHFLVTGKSPPD